MRSKTIKHRERNYTHKKQQQTDTKVETQKLLQSRQRGNTNTKHKQEKVTKELGALVNKQPIIWNPQTKTEFEK